MCAIGCTRQPLDQKAQFTREYLRQLHTAVPAGNFEITRELTIRAKSKDGDEHTIFLDNAYKQYEIDPNSKQDIFERLISSYKDLKQSTNVIEKSRIVPIIKDYAWLEES